MKRFFLSTIASSALFCAVVATTLVSCKGQDKAEEKPKADTIAVKPAPPDAATLAQIDKEIDAYLVAADSLGSLFERIKTVKDVYQSADKIARLSGALRHFQEQSARFGQPLVERMSMSRVDSAVSRLAHERERLQKDPKVYEKITAIEDGAKSPAEAK